MRPTKILLEILLKEFTTGTLLIPLNRRKYRGLCECSHFLRTEDIITMSEEEVISDLLEEEAAKHEKNIYCYLWGYYQMQPRIDWINK